MSLETWYDTGTVSVVGGATTVSGAGLFWGEDAIMPGDLFCNPAQPLVPPQRVKEVTSETTLELWAPWPGTTMTAANYEIRYVGIIERSTAQTRQVLEQLGEISAYFDVQVNTLADRAAFDARPSGYRVLVSDVGDGRAEIFSKNSSVSADWSDGAPLGEVGPTGAAGPIGVTWRGSWDNATVYAARDGVLYNGSSWRAKQANSNQPPPTLPTIENTYWHLVAQAGINGTGTGDVSGPASSVSGRIALFNGTTGKQLQQAGLLITDLEPARTKATSGDATAGTGTTVLGWAPQQIAQAILALSPSPADLEFTVSQLALLAADTSNVALFLGTNGNRVADTFDALTYVDVAGATNMDSSMAGVLKPTLLLGANQLPLMTAATTGGVTIDASSTLSGYDAWHVGDRSTAVELANTWVSAASATTGWVRVNFGAGNDKAIGGYTINAGGSVITRMPKNWTLEGSADGSTWSVIDTRTNQVFATNEVKSYAFANTTAYRYWRLNVSQNNGDGTYVQIGELTLNAVATINNMTVRSASFTASAVPTKMKALINVREVDAAVAGTDYTLECSRDGGTTWSVMTLTERYTSGLLRVVEAAETSVTGQPSGTSPRWRFKTLNNKNVELHDVYLYWS